MPRGFGYRVIRGRSGFPKALGPLGLYQAGLLSEAEYARAREKEGTAADGGCGGGCGTGCSS